MRAWAQFLDQMRGWRVVLTSLAATVLLVGGVGVLSVMLISFSDRRYEIGLRKAMGASDGEILVQFLLEACVLAAVGASFGHVPRDRRLQGAVGELPLRPRRQPDGPASIAWVTALVLAVTFGLYPGRPRVAAVARWRRCGRALQASSSLAPAKAGLAAEAHPKRPDRQGDEKADQYQRGRRIPAGQVQRERDLAPERPP